MVYPKFFDTIETIILQDELSNTLGVFDDGIVEFGYIDVVKSAGHSCPTVAGAYIMTLVGLKKLYGEELPKRGEIFVSFKEDASFGVAGVIANVISQITGATDTYGFKGLGGKFQRHSLMKFNENINSIVKFTRLDTNKSIEVTYNPNIIPSEPLLSSLMQKSLQNDLTIEEKERFGKLWQKRVEEIFNNIDKVITIIE